MPDDLVASRPLRLAGTATCAVAAVTQLPMMVTHPQPAATVFAVLAVAFVVEAAALFRGGDRRVWWWVAITGAAAVAAYVWSRSSDLSQVSDGAGTWVDPVGLIALSAASGAVAVAAAVLMPVARGSGGRGRVFGSRAKTILGVLVLTFGLGVTGVAAASATAPMAAMPGMQNSNNYWNDVAGDTFHATGVTRNYFIAADPVDWDYAPQHQNLITGQPFDDVANTYVKSGPGRIGSKYRKCLYRAYSDAKFGQLKSRVRSSESYLGLLGPVIRAEVGDTIHIVYRNNCSFGTSMHPHGVLYAKSSEGAPYDDGTGGSDKADDAVPTGGTHTYIWQVPERAGPGPR